MSVCIYSVFVLSYVQVAALRRIGALPRGPIKCVKVQETENAAKM
jgi:hypothetical protein